MRAIKSSYITLERVRKTNRISRDLAATSIQEGDSFRPPYTPSSFYFIPSRKSHSKKKNVFHIDRSSSVPRGVVNSD